MRIISDEPLFARDGMIRMISQSVIPPTADALLEVLSRWDNRNVSPPDKLRIEIIRCVFASVQSRVAPAAVYPYSMDLLNLLGNSGLNSLAIKTSDGTYAATWLFGDVSIHGFKISRVTLPRQLAFNSVFDMLVSFGVLMTSSLNYLPVSEMTQPFVAQPTPLIISNSIPIFKDMIFTSLIIDEPTNLPNPPIPVALPVSTNGFNVTVMFDGFFIGLIKP